MTRKWHIPLTYTPKIEPVRKGDCTQTIRTCSISESKKTPGKINKKAEGDLVQFFIWTGRPYWSKQKTITEYMEIWMAEDILIIPTGFLIYHNDKFQRELFWDSWEMEHLARLDFISPPTGTALRDVLIGKNGKIPAKGVKAQILRWNSC